MLRAKPLGEPFNTSSGKMAPVHVKKIFILVKNWAHAIWALHFNKIYIFIIAAQLSREYLRSTIIFLISKQLRAPFSIGDAL